MSDDVLKRAPEDDLDRAMKVIMEAIKDLPELQKMEILIVANALSYLALKFAASRGHDAARRMFQEMLKAVDVHEQESRVN